MTRYADPGPDRDPLANPANDPSLTTPGSVAPAPTVPIPTAPAPARPMQTAPVTDGAGAPREQPATEGSTYASQYARDTATGPDASDTLSRTNEASRTKEAAGSATAEVTRTAKREARNVAAEVGDQARRVMDDAKQKTSERLDSQQRQWSDQLDEISRELQQMAAQHPDSPAGRLVNQLADRSSTLADYLSTHRAQDLLADVQAFARRRPGTFLATMAAAGFVAGRLGKSVAVAAGEGDGGDGRVR